MPASTARELGSTGIRVSAVGIGCNNFGSPLTGLEAEGTREIVDAALDAGITHFDTAESYGGTKSETYLGEALKGRRDQAVIATKFGWRRPEDPDPGYAAGSAESVRRSVEGSLARLQTDYIDLYYYHRPDGVTPLDETLGAMSELVAEGKVRAIACSNFTPEQLNEAKAVAEAAGYTPFTVLQNRYSLLDREAESTTLPVCVRNGVGFVPYFPLANGLLTGKYRRGEAAPDGTRVQARNIEVTDEQWDRIDALAAFAEAHGRTLIELAIGGLAAQPGVLSVITGATKPEQARANAAAGGWALTDGELAELGAL